jgi:hypothetical protein
MYSSVDLQYNFIGSLSTNEYVGAPSTCSTPFNESAEGFFTPKYGVRILNPQKNLWIFSWIFWIFRIFAENFFWIFADLNPQKNLWIFMFFSDFPIFF